MGSGGSETCVSKLLCGTPAVCCGVGEECFAATCAPTCASGIRCGGDGSICCADGDVCLASECATPGAACEDSFDCPEGDFCEPTLARCLPQPTGSLCELRPESVTFEPTIEWHWQGWSQDDRYRQVQSTPAIADIDNDSLPEVVTVAYRATGNNMLVVLNGEDGSENLMIPDSTYDVRWGTGAAVGNLDADPELEIVFMTIDRVLVVIEHDGSEKWTADVSGGDKQGYPALANLDTDSETEIVIGGKWFDNDGALLHDMGWMGCNGEWCITAVADMNSPRPAEATTRSMISTAQVTRCPSSSVRAAETTASSGQCPCKTSPRASPGRAFSTSKATAKPRSSTTTNATSTSCREKTGASFSRWRTLRGPRQNTR